MACTITLTMLVADACASIVSAQEVKAVEVEVDVAAQSAAGSGDTVRFEDALALRGLGQVSRPDAIQRRHIKLGERLFQDPILSESGRTSCATCHDPSKAFTVNESRPAGDNGKRGPRNPPALINRHFSSVQFWDGRAASLEDQALMPLTMAHELGGSIDAVVARLSEHDEYPRLFNEAFGGEGISAGTLSRALAEFQRSLYSFDSPIDQFVTASGAGQLTRQERQGLWLYESKARCWQCHSGQNYTDEQFHNTGVSWGREPLDLGRFEYTEVENHQGQFKTPTLRDVALTAPYMHDGSIATLEDVVDFYNQGGGPNPHLDERIRPLDLSDEEKAALVAFLKALTGKHSWEPGSESE